MEGKTEIRTSDRAELVIATALLVISCCLSNVSYAENKARFTTTNSSSSSSAIADSSDASSKSIARVYQCTIDGQRAFSDQPCGTDSKARDIDAPNRMDASNPRNTVVNHRAPATRVTRRADRDDASDSNDDKKKRCAKIGNDKERITAQMRTGYSGKQGERLRDRLRKLDSDYFELRCSRYR